MKTDELPLDARRLSVLRGIASKDRVDFPLSVLVSRKGFPPMEERIKRAFRDIARHLADEQPLHGHEFSWKVGRVGAVLGRLLEGGWVDGWTDGSRPVREGWEKVIGNPRIATAILDGERMGQELGASLCRAEEQPFTGAGDDFFSATKEEVQLVKYLVMSRLGEREFKRKYFLRQMMDGGQMDEILRVSRILVKDHWLGILPYPLSDNVSVAHMIVEMDDDILPHAEGASGGDEVDLRKRSDLFMQEGVDALESDQALTPGKLVNAVYRKWIGPWYGPSCSLWAREMRREQLIELREEKLIPKMRCQ